MHMHCHLRECMLDYGPLHSFWLYAFERYNGILGAIPNNNHSIEIQMMKCFLRDSQIASSSLPHEFHDELLPFFPRLNQVSGSVADTISFNPSLAYSSAYDPISLNLKLPKNSLRKILHPTQKLYLTELYSALFSVPVSAIVISNSFLQYSSISLNGKTLGSHNSRMASSSIVVAEWDKSLFGS